MTVVRGQQLIGIMAVEQHFARHPLQYRYASRYLIDEHHVRLDVTEKRQVQRGVHHTQVAAQRVTLAQNRSRQPVADDRHRHRAVPGFLETMRGTVVIRDEPHGMTAFLHRHGRVNH